MANFDVIFENAQTMDVTFSENAFNVDFGPGAPIHDYTGEYEITPSSETQVLETANKTLDANIIVNPIPSNYGLITWDGSVITIS